MSKNKKPPYETPVIMPLGELARGFGAPCRTGSVASNKCETGSGVPPAACTTGHKAGGSCAKGNAFGR